MHAVRRSRMSATEEADGGRSEHPFHFSRRSAHFVGTPCRRRSERRARRVDRELPRKPSRRAPVQSPVPGARPLSFGWQHQTWGDELLRSLDWRRKRNLQQALNSFERIQGHMTIVVELRKYLFRLREDHTNPRAKWIAFGLRSPVLIRRIQSRLGGA